MRTIKISKLLVGAVAAFGLSVMSVHASNTAVEGSVIAGSNNTGSGIVSIAQGLNDTSAVMGKVRIGKLNDDVSISLANIDAVFKLSPNIAVHLGGGVLSHDDYLPVATGGVVLKAGLIEAYVDGYISDFENFGAKATMPLYSYNIDDMQRLTLSIYGEVNQAQIKDAQEGINEWERTQGKQITKIMRNAGVQVSFSF